MALQGVFSVNIRLVDQYFMKRLHMATLGNESISFVMFLFHGVMELKKQVLNLQAKQKRQ